LHYPRPSEHGSIFALRSLLDRQKVVDAKLRPRGATTALHPRPSRPGRTNAEGAPMNIMLFSMPDSKLFHTLHFSAAC